MDLPSQIAWGSVGAALALGLMIAPSEAAAALRARRYGQSLAATLLAITCAGFVLTGALGNAAAGRQSIATALDDATGKRARALSDHDRAQSALASLATVRAVGEIEAAITPLNAIIGDADCGVWVPNKSVRAACASRHPLLAEMARAEHRAELERHISVARTVIDAPRTVSPANADAEAVARYLRAVGVVVPVERVADVLVLIAVAAIEFGGALALVLARSGTMGTATLGTSSGTSLGTMGTAVRAPMSNTVPRPKAVTTPKAPKAPVHAGLGSLGTNVVMLPKPPKPTSAQAAQGTLAHAKAEIARLAQDGTLPTSQRAICEALGGTSKGTVGTAIAQLLSEGVVVGTVGKSGTVLRLRA